MPEFLELVPPDEALVKLLKYIPLQPASEEVPTSKALGRISTKAVAAPHPLPSFKRSTVDGFAVRAMDTHGAGESLPSYLKMIGEIPMGSTGNLVIKAGECAEIHTGGMLPDGADSVVMIEYTQQTRPNEVEILRAVAAGENTLMVGEDVYEGEEVIHSGARLQPAEIGGLAALGITTIQVAKKPKVAILATGDEIVSLEAEILPGQVRDVNTYTLSALVEENGGTPVCYGILPDNVEELLAAASKALKECDLVVITAGSSASARDLTASVINQLGEPGVLVHGVNVQPGKPTILAVCKSKPVIGLPGNPVSALVIASLFIVPLLETMLGITRRPLRASIPARLTINLPSRAGREDWVAVRLLPSTQGYLAEPVFGKSNLIFTLVRADGLICIPQDLTGLQAGVLVQVHLL